VREGRKEGEAMQRANEKGETSEERADMRDERR
jgi:hypothetical protein